MILLANTKFEIQLKDKFNGAASKTRIMGQGKSDGNGNFSTTVTCDTSLLNRDDYYIYIRYYWNVNTIQVCYDSTTSLKLDDYPIGGITNLNIETYKKCDTKLYFVKKSKDSIKAAFACVHKACNFYSCSNFLSTSNDVVNSFTSKAILNNMNYVTITTYDLLNIKHEIIDSVFIDENFAGKTFEY